MASGERKEELAVQARTPRLAQEADHGVVRDEWALPSKLLALYSARVRREKGERWHER
jgi:hypothetical protein